MLLTAACIADYCWDMGLAVAGKHCNTACLLLYERVHVRHLTRTHTKQLQAVMQSLPATAKAMLSL